MNTQDLINQAKQAKVLCCDGYRQFSGNHHGVECMIISRDNYNWKVQDYVQSERTYFTLWATASPAPKQKPS